jgi:hypothetical protein
MMSIQTQPNPEFKIAQPLPRLGGDLTPVRKSTVGCFIPGPPSRRAGELTFPSLALAPRLPGEGDRPRP